MLATVLFFDVVQSTALASELGDKRWGELLVRMRRTVDRTLKQSGGREQDFSGDGFLAVFSEPAQAVRAAVAIVAALHRLGLDVRCGVHAGECEVIDGKMRGIAVHIGARVMSLAGAAEVLVTGTVRELVVGSGIRFEEAGVHELKGVEGTWLAYRAVEVDGGSVEPPLAPEAASERIGALDLGQARRRIVGAGVAAVTVAVGLAVAILVFALRGSGPPRFGTNSVVRIDPVSGRVLRIVADPHAVENSPTYVFASRGTLWDWDNNYGFERRDMQTGQLLAAFGGSPGAGHLAGCPYEPGWDIAFGTIWLWCNSNPDFSPPYWLVRRDELSYSHLATTRLPKRFIVTSAGWGLGAYWVLDETGHLVRVDAATSRITGTYSLPLNGLTSCSNPPNYPGAVGPIIVNGTLWFAQCNPNKLVAFDPSTRRAVSFPIPQSVGWLMYVPVSLEDLWLFDPTGGTLTPFDTGVKKLGDSLALPGTPQSTAVVRDSIWVAAGTAVDRVDTAFTPPVITTIAMPAGLWASSIAVDPSGGTIWVTNNAYAKSNPQWAGGGGP